LRTLLHSIMSDVVIEDVSTIGLHDPLGKIAKIRKDPYLSSQIESMAVTLEAFGMVQYRNQNNEIATRPVRVMGIELKSRSGVGGFRENLKSYQDQKKRNEENQTNDPIREPSFDIPDEIRKRFERAEQELRKSRERAFEEAKRNLFAPPKKEPEDFQFPKLPEMNGEPNIGLTDKVKWLFEEGKIGKPPAAPIPPPMPVPYVPRVPPGAIVGHLITHFNYRDSDTGEIKQGVAIHPGDSIVLTTVNS